VHCENLLVNNSCNGQAVEAVCECLPQLNVIPSLALIIEAINSVDGSALMVTTQNEEVLGVLDLVCEQQTDCLEGLLASVDIVT